MTLTVEASEIDRAADGALPLVRELVPAPEPVEALRRLAGLEGVLLFHSAAERGRLGRFSFLTAEPFRWFRLGRAEPGVDPLGPIAELLGAVACDPVTGLPPFQGGAAGLLGYELGGAWERLPEPRDDDLDVPVLAVGVYDWTVAWDHERGLAWVISQGLPADDTAERRARAESRLGWVMRRLAGPPTDPKPGVSARIRVPQASSPAPNPPASAEVTSTFSRDGYLRAVERVVEYVRAGDIFQANLSQRLSVPYAGPAVDLYEKLCEVNPAPFAGYFAAEDWVVLSASPERFLEVRGDRVETRPIKGTRPRSADPTEDERLKRELVASEKDRAENVMIVDLLRNDLSRVCRTGSVEVPELCSPESYETVHHLVSAVTGRLDRGKTAWDLLAAAFPGGSITGAPKVRAMEILRELEPTVRGPYCGSLFYVGFDGSTDSNILIRTLTLKDGVAHLGVGGGITAASDPEAEYAETLHKAAGMLRALEAEPRL